MRSRVLADVVALFAPPGCAACRTPLEDARELVCAACRRALPWLAGPACERCGLPAPCAPCPAARAAFDRASAPLAYAGPARRLVVALKFGGALALADLMAAQMAAGVTEGWLVAVPGHPTHVRRRGFDQAERLTAALSRRTGLPIAPCLRRAGAPARQLGTPRRQRLRAERIEVFVSGAAPAHCVLVDDVHTTGATLDACARALRAGGARRVSAVTYARTLRG